ncbi:MAG: DedA family protein [Alphaproteobacteria bacterium]|nr:DedA family protein [Alphaproteobacteria bacterium]MDE2109936.1 DedA family protein [Alphaproteobacteria bacterium]MDE2496089.1 DedA family protein [Alphaproteobacteria bacterium]
MDNLSHLIIAYITAHPDVAIFVIGATAFGESFAFLSLLFPGTTILIAAGALVKAHALDPVSAAAAGSAGAVLGDAISFWIGRRFGGAVPNLWPFRRHPDALEKGIAFFRRYGWASVFIGRFFGPLRAIVPLAAGMMEMPTVPFYVANCLSAIVWAPALLLSGFLLSSAASSGWDIEDKLFVIALAAAAVIAAVYWARRLFQVR